MNIEKIRSALTNKIHATFSDELDENELASVLIIIYGKEPMILMTEKAKTLKVHAGEIAFPGGKWCEQDQDLLETAIRETREELGLKVSKEQVIGKLDSVITLNSKYKIKYMKQLGRKRPSFIGCLTSSAQLHAYPFVVTDFLHIA